MTGSEVRCQTPCDTSVEHFVEVFATLWKSGRSGRWWNDFWMAYSRYSMFTCCLWDGDQIEIYSSKLPAEVIAARLEAVAAEAGVSLIREET